MSSARFLSSLPSAPADRCLAPNPSICASLVSFSLPLSAPAQVRCFFPSRALRHSPRSGPLTLLCRAKSPGVWHRFSKHCSSRSAQRRQARCCRRLCRRAGAIRRRSGRLGRRVQHRVQRLGQLNGRKSPFILYTQDSSTSAETEKLFHHLRARAEMPDCDLCQRVGQLRLCGHCHHSNGYLRRLPRRREQGRRRL